MQQCPHLCHRNLIAQAQANSTILYLVSQVSLVNIIGTNISIDIAKLLVNQITTVSDFNEILDQFNLKSIIIVIDENL
jgi:hypothetical protein